MRRSLPWMAIFVLGCVEGPAPRTEGQAVAPRIKNVPTLVSENPRELNSAEDLRKRNTGSDWPTFLGSTGNSVSTETGILKPWPEAGPKLRWQTKLHIGYGIPSISRGRCFIFEREKNRARLRVLNSETGDFLWQYEYDTEYEDMYGYNNGPRCSPVVDGDRVYLYGVEGLLHCLAVADGKLLWRVNTIEEFGVVQNFFGVGSTPVIEGDLLIAMVGGSPPGSGQRPTLEQKGNGTGIVAFDKITGAIKYKLSEELASYSGPTLATIDGRRWCFALARGGLIGFDPTTGKQDFHFPWRANFLESVNASNPVVVDKEVLITECYQIGGAVLRVKPGGFDVVWDDSKRGRDKSLMCHWNTPVHHGGYVYGSSGRHENAELRCVEWKTGKVMWSEPDLSRCSLLSIDGHFICQAEDGWLYLFKVNPEKFDLVSKVMLIERNAKGEPVLGESGKPIRLLKPPAWAAPVVSQGLLYVRGDNRLVCLELIPEK